MKNKIQFLFLLTAGLVLAQPARAQTTTPITVTVTNASGGASTITGTPADISALIGLPSGVTPAAFNPGGLDFTNVSFKAAAGSDYAANGATKAFITGDWDFYHGSALDLGVGANADLSPTGTGLYNAAVDFELIKNFSNFQLQGQLGVGGFFQGKSALYGEAVAEINYNLAKGTGIAWLGGAGNSSVFSYVGGNVSAQFNGVALEKAVRLYVGVAF